MRSFIAIVLLMCMFSQALGGKELLLSLGCTETEVDSFMECKMMGLEALKSMGIPPPPAAMGIMHGEEDMDEEEIVDKMLEHMKMGMYKMKEKCEQIKTCITDADCIENPIDCGDELMSLLTEDQYDALMSCKKQTMVATMVEFKENFEGCMMDVYDYEMDAPSRRRRRREAGGDYGLGSDGLLVRMASIKSKMQGGKKDMLMMNQKVQYHCSTMQQRTDAKICLKSMPMGDMQDMADKLNYMKGTCNNMKACTKDLLSDTCGKVMDDLKQNMCMCAAESRPARGQIGQAVNECFKEETGVDIPEEMMNKMKEMEEGMEKMTGDKKCEADPCDKLQENIMMLLRGKAKMLMGGA